MLGSIYTGWATPTEAAALGVVGALIVAVANELYRKISNNTTAIILVGILLFPVVVFALDDYVQQRRGRLWAPLPCWCFWVSYSSLPGIWPFTSLASVASCLCFLRKTGGRTRGAVQNMVLDAIISTVRTSSMIMLIVMAAFTLSFALRAWASPRTSRSGSPA